MGDQSKKKVSSKVFIQIDFTVISSNNKTALTLTWLNDFTSLQLYS